MGEDKKQAIDLTLESKHYNVLVDGTMPVLNFHITPGKASSDPSKSQNLRLELYNPMAGEVFEAKFPKGRIEVDNDGSVAYFSTSVEKVNVSLFLGHNIQINLHKDGSVVIKSPSKIVDLETDLRSSKGSKREVELWDIVVVAKGLKLRFDPPASARAVYVPALESAMTPTRSRIAVRLLIDRLLLWCRMV